MKKLFLFLFTCILSSVSFSQNIGIGTPSPAFKLHVLTENYSTEIARFQSNGGIGLLQVGTGNMLSYLGVNESFGFAGTSAAQDFTLRTGGTTRLFIRNADGNIGIGTDNPLHKLDVQAYGLPEIARFRNTTSDNANISVTNGPGLVDFGLNTEGGYVGTVTAGDFMIRTNYAVRMFFENDNGFIGIGTPYPAHKIDIQAFDQIEIAKFRNTTTDNAKIGVSNSIGSVDFGLNNDGGFVGTVDGGDFRIRTNYSVRMFFRNSDGFVGINTDAPSQRLDVNGNIALSGNIMVDPPSNASLLNGWTIYDSSFGTPRYSKDKQGRVLISGLAEHTPTPGGHVFTLPAGYRPEKSMYFLAASDHPNGFNKVLINHTNGEVSVVTTGSNITWVSFDNITFIGN